MLNVDSQIVLCDLNNCCTDSVAGMQIMQRSAMTNLGCDSGSILILNKNCPLNVVYYCWRIKLVC